MRQALTVAAIAITIASICCAPAAFATQQCEGPLKRNPADFVPLADGAQLLDKQTGLIWMRCIEDQQWTGTVCAALDPQAVNPGPRLTFKQAQGLARAKATREEPWRLPTQKELLTLREANCYNPSMSLALFPTQPEWSSDGAFWTATREAAGYALVSAIGRSDAWAQADASNTHHVRLVRNAPTPPTKAMPSASASASALPPKYLAVPAFRECLAQQQVRSYTAWCLPSSRPDLCPADSWGRLNALTGIDKLPACPNPKPPESRS
jgi:hypothetical protein